MQKLIGQVAIRTVHFNTIKTYRLGIFCAFSKSFDNAGNFIKLKDSRCHKGFHWAHQANVALRGNRTGRHVLRTVQIIGIGYANDVQ